MEIVDDRVQNFMVKRLARGVMKVKDTVHHDKPSKRMEVYDGVEIWLEFTGLRMIWINAKEKHSLPR